MKKITLNIFIISLIFLLSISFINAVAPTDNVFLAYDFTKSLNDMSTIKPYTYNCTLSNVSIIRNNLGVTLNSSYANQWLNCGYLNSAINTNKTMVAYFNNNNMVYVLNNEGSLFAIQNYTTSRNGFQFSVWVNPTLITRSSFYTTGDNGGTVFLGSAFVNKSNTLQSVGLVANLDNTVQVYANGNLTPYYSGSRSDVLTDNGGQIIFGMKQNNPTPAPANFWNGTIKYFILYNRSLTAQEIQDIDTNFKNNITYPFVANQQQNNSYNITNTLNSTTNLINMTSNLTPIQFISNINNFNSSNLSNNSSMTFYYNITTALNNGCAIFEQQVCINNGSNQSVLMDKTNNTYYTTTLYDNMYLPANYPFNYVTIDNSDHLNYSLYKNNYVEYIVYNFSTNTNSYLLNLEFNAVTPSTNSLLVYYCNSSYNGNNAATNNNCELVDNFLPTTAYAHIHKKNSKHQLIPITIQSVTKTSISYFIFENTGDLAHSWNVEYTTNTSYNNASFKTGNYGAFVNSSKLFDMHIHPIQQTTDYFSYWTVFNDSTITQNSSFNKLFYNIIYNNPSATNFIYPDCSLQNSITVNKNSKQSIYFSWYNSSDQNNLTFTYYLYFNNGLIATLNKSTTFFNWTNINSTTIQNGNYSFNIQTCNINGCDNGLSQCSFNICQNVFMKSLQPCINSVKLINYSDINNCNYIYSSDIPLDNGLYENCTIVPTTSINNVTIKIDDTLLIVLLLLFLIISSFIIGVRSSGIYKIFIGISGVFLIAFSVIIKIIYINFTNDIMYYLVNILSSIFILVGVILFILSLIEILKKNDK